jgi:hypothetical protein
MTIGNGPYGTAFEGLIDEVRTYQEVLRKPHIKTLAGKVGDDGQPLVYFGTDSSMARSDNFPEEIYNPDFYVGRIGQGRYVNDAEDGCRIVWLEGADKGKDVQTGVEIEADWRWCLFYTEVAEAAGFDSAYAFYWLWGPTLADEYGYGLEDYGIAQAEHAIRKWETYQPKPDPDIPYIGGKVMFADVEEPIENPPEEDDDDEDPDQADTAGWETCDPWDAPCQRDNQRVIEGFLRTVEAHPELQPGIYMRTGNWLEFFGPDFIPKDEQGEEIPFVLWLAGCATTQGTAASFDKENTAGALPTAMENVLGGQRPVIWQYHINKPDLDATLRHPADPGFFDPLPATDIQGNRIVSSCTCEYVRYTGFNCVEQCTPWLGPPWSDPYGELVIHYNFQNKKEFNRGRITNIASASNAYHGLVEGDAELAKADKGGLPSGYLLELDGDTAYVESDSSEDIAFDEETYTGVAVSALVRRDTNTGEDAIVSKWFGVDQWLLTFYPGGNGKLIFTVKLATEYEGVEYLIPDSHYLGEWTHVAALYQSGFLRLYFDGILVAKHQVPYVDPEELRLGPSARRIHVGDAGPGVVWSRFDGQIDDLKVWIVTLPPFD